MKSDKKSTVSIKLKYQIWINPNKGDLDLKNDDPQDLSQDSWNTTKPNRTDSDF